MEQISEGYALSLLRSDVEEAGGLRPWCRKHKVNTGYLASILAGRTRPGPTVLAPLGLRRVEVIECIPSLVGSDSQDDAQQSPSAAAPCPPAPSAASSEPPEA